MDLAREVAQLREAWAGVATQGQGVALVDEPGSGKSSLVSEFCRSIEGEGTTAVVSRGHEGESGLPYVAIADLPRAVAAIRPELAAQLPPRLPGRSVGWPPT